MNTKKITFLAAITIFILMNVSLFSQGWLYTSGNRIYKADGTVFAGKGANVFDTRQCWAGSYANADDVKEEAIRRVDELVDVWGANFMRLCLESHESLDQWQLHGYTVLEDTAYINDIVEIVEHIGTKDSVYVLVSIWTDPSLDNSGLPTEETIDEWEIIVPKLAKYSHVIFGVCNEPRGNDDAQAWTQMNNAVAAIRAAETAAGSAEHIITVQGTGGYARYLEYYTTHPITASGGTNIAYEVHVYDHEDDFNDRFINPSQTIPVVIGEFGPAVMDGYLYMSIDECELMMDLADSLQIPYTAWSFHQRCPPNLIVDYLGSGYGPMMDLTPTEWGELLKNHMLGIEVPKITDFIVSPTSISNQTSNEITISANITNEGGSITSVSVDLSELGGGSAVVMPNTGDEYSVSYTVLSGLSTGAKTITINATNEQGYDKEKNVIINVYEPATSDMIIYNDSESLVEQTWSYNGTLSEISSGAAEGNNHYQFEFSGAWAGFGLHFNNWTGDGTGYDFTGYESIQFSYRLTGASVSLVMRMLDAGTTDENPNLGTTNLNSIPDTYQTITIPLSSFEDFTPDDVAEINFMVNSSSATGTFYIDDIRLLPLVTSAEKQQISKPAEFALNQNYPNPFNPTTTINYQLPQNGNVILKIYDILGREVITLVNEEKVAGNYAVQWNGNNSNGQIAGSGVYIYQLNYNGNIVSKRMSLLK